MFGLSQTLDVAKFNQIGMYQGEFSLNSFCTWLQKALHTFSLLTAFMAHTQPVSLFLASFTTPKLPFPRTSPNS